MSDPGSEMNMTNQITPARGRRALAIVAAATLGLGMLVAVAGAAVTATATAGPAGAVGKVVTYSASSVRPYTLPNKFSGAVFSDGWAVALSTSQVFNISHHSPDLLVTCHNQSDGTFCWSGQTKTVTNGSFHYSIPVGAGLYLDQPSGHLFTFAVQTNGTPSQNTAGVVCVDTTKPVTATGASLFCGFTPLSAAGEAPIPSGQGMYAGITAPVQIGTKWYAFNEVDGVGTAAGTGHTENTLMCFDLATFHACSTANYTVGLAGTITGPFGTAPPLGASGTDVLVPVNGTSPAVQMGCFDTLTGANCTGAWPVTLTALGGAPLPLLNTSGTPVGVCVPVAPDPCFNYSGATVATPANLATVIGTNRMANGAPVVIGTSMYVANQVNDKVACYNFATSAGCANYPRAFTGLSALYTVNKDPSRPNCLWVNSGAGSQPIQNFDATTTGTCSPGPVRLQASSLVDPTPGCTPLASQPTTYQSLQITTPPRGSYASAQVQVANAQGVLQPGAPQPANAFGTFDLTKFAYTGNLLPQFIVTFSGLSPTPASVVLKLTWNAPYAPACIAEGQSASNIAGYWMVASDGGIFNYGNAGYYGSTGNIALNKPIVGMAVPVSRGGYWLVASDGGIFAFGYAGFYGSTGNIALNQPIVGMSATPDGKGYWMVARDGGIFAFGDAPFFGSAGNIHLNQPIVGMAATPDGGGYWLVASDGGVFSYGDAHFYGSTGNIHLNKPIVGMAANPNGGGYWMVATDGGIFAFGSAGFYGSTGAIHLNKPIVGMSPTALGDGYWLAASDGGIFNYGGATFGGSAGGLPLNKPIVAITS
jgi:hypothetical protein